MQDRPPATAPGEDVQAVRPAALRFRFGTQADLAACAELLPPGFQASMTVRRRIIDLWSQLLAGESRTFAVIEDLERPHPSGFEGFGLSVFVSDHFVDKFCASPQPYLPALFYERMLAGDDVVLTPQQLADANTTAGINILVLHFGLRNHDLSDARTVQVLGTGGAAFYFFHAGYRVRTIINETFGAASATYMTAGGFRMINDFQKQSPAAFAEVPPEQYPYLFMLRQEWVEPAAVNPLTQLFLAPAPRIGFSATERRVLERALLNEADGSIARSLGISGDAVKKTWRNIHDRVGRNAPYLLPQAHRSPGGSRGQEKRRHLLDYLRLHMEELRPTRK